MIIKTDSDDTPLAVERLLPTHEVFSSIGDYYDDLVVRYGYDFRACDYGRAESQKRKFEVLAEVSSFDGRSVLDVGCGFADFSDFLNTRFRDIRYTGVDLSLEMIAAARNAHPGLDLRRLDILAEDVGEFDLVLANGIFYLLGTEAWPIMQRLIQRMFACAREAIAFNSLSSFAPNQEAAEFYAAPAEVLAFCQTLSPRVVLRHDYHDRDFSVFIYK